MPEQIGNGGAKGQQRANPMQRRGWQPIKHMICQHPSGQQQRGRSELAQRIQRRHRQQPDDVPGHKPPVGNRQVEKECPPPGDEQAPDAAHRAEESQPGCQKYEVCHPLQDGHGDLIAGSCRPARHPRNDPAERPINHFQQRIEQIILGGRRVQDRAKGAQPIPIGQIQQGTHSKQQTNAPERAAHPCCYAWHLTQHVPEIEWQQDGERVFYVKRQGKGQQRQNLAAAQQAPDAQQEEKEHHGIVVAATRKLKERQGIPGIEQCSHDPTARRHYP